MHKNGNVLIYTFTVWAHGAQDCVIKTTKSSGILGAFFKKKQMDI